MTSKSLSRAEQVSLAEALAELERRTVKRECEASLTAFIRHAWHVVEPGQRYVNNWHIDAVAEHLEAVYRAVSQGDGDLNRLLMNVPPGTMKSLLTCVFFVAWVWTKDPSKRFLAASHSLDNAVRDSLKCRRLIESDWYQELWGSTVSLVGDQNAKTKFENTATGFREAAAFTSMTGRRADFVILDDPMSVDDALSEATRDSINLTFREALPTRLNNPDKSAIIVIMQRLHEEDTSGVILDGDYGYEHLCLPMRFDPLRACKTSIGFVDPRTEEGELLFPERFPDWVVDRDERVMGPIATAGQMQQSPIPRGGSIIKPGYWQVWEDEKYPPFEFVLASADTAYTEKEENDPTGFTVWGVYRDERDRPKLMLCWAWAKHCELHGKPLERKDGESKRAYDIRSMPSWGLVEWIAYSCRRFKVDKLLIEAKASGLTVAQEMQRLYREDGWQIELVKPVGDKVARAHAVEPTFAAGLVFAPDEDWADKVIAQCEVFPKGKHDDLCFVAGTLIATRRGPVPIESVTTSDKVLTPLGWRSVKALGMTGVRPVIASASLVGTTGHPIFTFDKGFVPLGDLGSDPKLSRLSVCDLMRTAHLMKLSSKGWFTDVWAESADTICRNLEQTQGVAAQKVSTSPSGRAEAGERFLPGMKSIIRIATLLILSLTILSAYRSACIGQCLRRMARNTWNTLLEYGQVLLHGIPLLKVLSGIGNTQRTAFASQASKGTARFWAPVNASGADAVFLCGASAKSIAPLSVKASMPGNAEENTSSSTPILKPVFNLTVEGCPVYYANGVLVHNCDSMTQALQWLRRSGLIAHNFEVAAELRDALQFRPADKALYDA